jgi:hypothetical protein
MTKNASDLFKALVQNPLEKNAQPLEREGNMVQAALVNPASPKTHQAARAGKKAIHASLQPSPNELERDPSGAEPLDKTQTSALAKGKTASAKPASDSGAESLDTVAQDAFELTQGESERLNESGLPPGQFGNSLVLAQASTETSLPSTETKGTAEALQATATSPPTAPWAWFIPVALAGVGMVKSSSTTSDSLTRLRVVDGPIRDAKVYVDLDNDGVVDDGEPEVGFTDSDGYANVTLTAEQAKYALLAKGGVDTETNKAFAGVHAAPAGSTVINPLTTLVAALMEGGQSLAEAKEAVVTALGLTGVTDLTSYDTFAQASTPDGMANHLKAVQIANIIVAGSALAASDNTAAAQTGAASRVIDALASKIAGTSGAVTFNAQVLEDVLTTAGATSHAASVAAAIEAVNTVVANASGPNALVQVAQAQVLAQVTLSNAIKTADTGGLAIVAALQNSETAAQLAIQIDAKSSDVTAPTLAITSSATVVKAGESAIITFSFSEAPTGFEASDVTTTGGTLSTPTVSSTDPKVYTATFTPTLAAGSASISVGNASYTDAAGNSAGSTPEILIEKPVVPVEIVFAQRVIMDGATVGGDPSIANLQTTAIKYSLTTNVSIQGLDVDDFLVTNGEVTRVYQPASTDPLKWMVEVKPLYGVEGEIELSLIPDATITDIEGNPLNLGALPATPLVTVDTLGAAPSVLNINSRTNGSISVNGETDLYSIQLTEGEKYIFTLEAGSSLTLDAGLNLFGPSPSSNTISLLTNDNAFQLNNNARIIYTAQETSTYYLLANGGTNSSGDYLLSVSDQNVPTPSRIAIPNPPSDAASQNPDIQWKFIPNRGTGEEFYLIVDAPKNSPLWTAENLPYWTDPANRSLLVDISSGQEFKHNGDQDGVRSGNIFAWDGPTVQTHVMQDLSRNTDYVYVVPKDAITGVNGFTNDYYESTVYHTTNDAAGPMAISGGVILNVFNSDTFFPIDPSWANLKLDDASSSTYSEPFILDNVPDLLWIQFDEKIRSSTGGWNQGWAAKHNDVFDGVYLKENGVSILEFDVNFDDIQHDPNQWGAPFRYPTGLLNVKAMGSEVVGGLPWVDYSGLENGMWLNLHQAVSNWGDQYVSDDYVNHYEFKAGAIYTLVVDAPIEDIYFNVSDDSTPVFEFSFIIKPIQDPLAV